MHFQYESMSEILETLQKHFQRSNTLTFEVLNPDISEGSYAGEIIQEHIYRSYRTWMDVANILECRMLTPQVTSSNLIKITFKKLNNSRSFHKSKLDDKSEKYGLGSTFSRINKNEEASFINAYTKALKNIKIEGRKSILNLGINRADEFETIQNLVPSEIFEGMNLVGIDHSKSAIEYAQNRFKQASFYAHDINKIDELALSKFDLLISIGTLQTLGINFKPFFNSLIQNYLQDSAVIILAFPNSRWIDGEMVYGAKMVNYSESDLSLLINDIHYCKKYLQQKKFKVRIYGKEYIFLSAFKT